MLLTARSVDLIQEGFDLAVRADVLADSSLLAHKLGIADLGLFASPAYLARAGRPRRPADLAAHECVLYRVT
jgi:DNA-binding transcriptional LysR family regulator